MIGTLTALSVHVGALYTPAFQQLLSIAPPSFDEWVRLAAYAASIVVVMELHKALRARWPIRRPAVAVARSLAEA